MTQPPVNLDDARQQVRALEDAITRLRERHARADPRALAAYLNSLVQELWKLRDQIDTTLGLDSVVSDYAALWIRLKGGAVGEGRAPATAIGKVLESIQTGVKQAAAYVETNRAFLRGVPKEIAEEATLDMVAFAPGSARIALATASPQLRVDLPRPLAEVALELILRAVEWAEKTGNDETLQQMFPDPVIRRQVASRIREIAPGEARSYDVVEFSGAVLRDEQRIVVTAKANQHATEYLKRRTSEQGSYRGQLVAIDIERDVLNLRHAGRRIHCAFRRTLLDRAKKLVGEYVEVTGLALFHEDDEVPYRINVKSLRQLRTEEHREL